jgi:hypothetical protein
MNWLKRNNKKCKAWIAISAILVQSLLPSLIYAAIPDGTLFSEICTTSGTKPAAAVAPGAQDNVPDRAFHAGSHCVLCAAAHAPALLPAAADFSVPQPGAAQAIPGILSVAFLPPAGLVPPPRGPPSFS